MREPIVAGSILIERSAPLPDSWLFRGELFSNGWISFGNLDRSGIKSSISKAGLTFFYLAGEIKATVFGFDRQAVVLKAVKRIAAKVKSQHWNGLEITRVAMSAFLGIPYASVTGHARHVQEGLVLSRATTLLERASAPSVAGWSGRRQRSDIRHEPLFAEEAVAAWEDEGGAPGHTDGRLAA